MGAKLLFSMVVTCEKKIKKRENNLDSAALKLLFSYDFSSNIQEAKRDCCSFFFLNSCHQNNI